MPRIRIILLGIGYVGSNFGLLYGQAAVEPDVAWAKMAAMAKGDRIASREFWKRLRRQGTTSKPKPTPVHLPRPSRQDSLRYTVCGDFRTFCKTDGYAVGRDAHTLLAPCDIDALDRPKLCSCGSIYNGA